MTIIFFLLTSVLSQAMELRPFVSDGCTMSPDGTWRDRDKWKDCCLAHDLRLWGGGTKSERVDADWKLRSCMEDKAGPKIAKIFWLGVRLGSHSPFKLPGKEWGNAWGEASGYRPLSLDEKAQLVLQVQELEISPELKEEYTRELEARN